MNKWEDKYRIPSARASWWNYGDEAAYFITICTKNKEHYFGEVIDDIMVETKLGKVVVDEWIKTPMLRADMNVELGAFIVMPNHFHGIIIIGQNQYNLDGDEVNNTFRPQAKNLASIMRGFKSAVTLYARTNQIVFDWQPRFHDHIIRNESSYDTITKYILSNPASWSKDTFYQSKP